MIFIPIQDYDDNLSFGNRLNVKIIGYSSTGKTLRFDYVLDDSSIVHHVYALHPSLPKVNYLDWNIDGLDIVWGNELLEEAIEVMIDDGDYAVGFYHGHWYITTYTYVRDSTKADIEAAEKYFDNTTLADAIREIGKPLSKQVADDRVDAVATGIWLNQEEYQILKGKEQNTMNGLFDAIKVGKASQEYSITYFGTVAFRGKTYYKGKIFDATGMTINFDMLYLVPASEVKEGDIVDKNGKAYYVKGVSNGIVNAIDLMAGTEENLVPGGPFGMTLYSKIFNPFGSMKGENAFGNMLMLQALSDNKGGNNGMLMAMMMMQGGFKLPTFEMPNLDLPKEETK